LTAFHGMLAAGLATHERGSNHLDGGAHFYNAYECADGRWISVAAIEGKFYAELLRRLDLDPAGLPAQMDRTTWPELQARFAALFKTRSRGEWCALLEGTDACFAPVLTMEEAPRHPHNIARGSFVDVGGVVQPAPAPRFSRTPAARPTAPHDSGADPAGVLGGWEIAKEKIETLTAKGVLGK
jgi:alpha-methylacyl-CoA racemase